MVLDSGLVGSLAAKMTFVRQIKLGIDLVQPLQPAPTPKKFLKQNPESLWKEKKKKIPPPALSIVVQFSVGFYSLVSSQP